MAERFMRDEDIDLKSNVYMPIQYSAYERGFMRFIDYASTLQWFTFADYSEALAMRDEGQEKESPDIKVVREALSKALRGDYERPRMKGNPPEFVISRKSDRCVLKISQLSDGYRSMLALVMDLARRMAESQMSGGGEPTEQLLSTPAIVLIDEVELHLHPAWQQTVLTTLMEIFPNTQFIVTSHSPQVLTSVSPEHIRILKDGKAYTVGMQTEGAEASQLLKYLFDVDLRPANLDVVRTLNDYRKLVYDEQWDTQEAEEMKKKLTQHFGNDDLELKKLELHIENTIWERSL
jgi:predicted ATP-binding protein involved in virulence